jgi:hypothetical protein
MVENRASADERASYAATDRIGSARDCGALRLSELAFSKWERLQTFVTTGGLLAGQSRDAAPFHLPAMGKV